VHRPPNDYTYLRLSLPRVSCLSFLSSCILQIQFTHSPCQHISFQPILLMPTSSSKRTASESNTVDSSQSSQPAKKTRRTCLNFRLANDSKPSRNVSAKTIKHLTSGHLSTRRVNVENLQPKPTSEVDGNIDMGVGGSASASPSIAAGGSHSPASLPSGDNVNDQAVTMPEAEGTAAPLKPKRKKRVNTTSVCISTVVLNSKQLILISRDFKSGFSTAQALWMSCFDTTVSVTTLVSAPASTVRRARGIIDASIASVDVSFTALSVWLKLIVPFHCTGLR